MTTKVLSMYDIMEALQEVGGSVDIRFTAGQIMAKVKFPGATLEYNFDCETEHAGLLELAKRLTPTVNLYTQQTMEAMTKLFSSSSATP